MKPPRIQLFSGATQPFQKLYRRIRQPNNIQPSYTSELRCPINKTSKNKRHVDFQEIKQQSQNIPGRLDLENSGISLAKSNMKGADLRNANLSGTDLSGANLEEVNLSGADLAKANLREIHATYANMKGVNLHGADLDRANVSNSDLTEAKIINASARGMNAHNSNLREANFNGTNLQGSNLQNSDLRDLEFDEKTNLQNTRYVGSKVNNPRRLVKQSLEQAVDSNSGFLNAMDHVASFGLMKDLHDSRHRSPKINVPNPRSHKEYVDAIPEKYFWGKVDDITDKMTGLSPVTQIYNAASGIYKKVDKNLPKSLQDTPVNRGTSLRDHVKNALDNGWLDDTPVKLPRLQPLRNLLNLRFENFFTKMISRF